jgi:hypothetical protein
MVFVAALPRAGKTSLDTDLLLLVIPTGMPLDLPQFSTTRNVPKCSTAESCNGSTHISRSASRESLRRPPFRFLTAQEPSPRLSSLSVWESHPVDCKRSGVSSSLRISRMVRPLP